MDFIKLLILTCLLSLKLFATLNNEIIFLEDKDEKLNLQDEFFNPKTKIYTLSIVSLPEKVDVLNYFRVNGMKNTLAYKFGENKEHYRVILGAFNNIESAQQKLNSLNSALKSNKPYIAKLTRHQKLYNKYNKSIYSKNIQNKTLSIDISKKIIGKKEQEKIPKQSLKEYSNSVFISNSKYAKRLREEFLRKDSKYYSIAVATIPLSKNSLKNFYSQNSIFDKSLAHIYGKKRDKIRVIYGLFKSSKEAKEAIKNLNAKIKLNQPFYMKMEKFQAFYQKHLLDKSIVELRIKDKKVQEKKVEVKLSNKIKIIKPEEPKKTVNEKIALKEKKEQLNKSTKYIKEKEPKQIKKEEKQKESNLVVSFVKSSKYEDIYFVEDGEINILNEVFLDENSSFYTVDLALIDLDEISIKEFYIKNDLNNNSLAYKFGDDKKEAKIIFGAYESERQAKEAAEELRNYVDYIPQVSNIKEHQELYKRYHKRVKKGIGIELFYLQKSGNNELIEEFIKKSSSKFTINLAAIVKKRDILERFIIDNSLQNDILVYEIQKSYYKIFLGVFETLKEAKDKIGKLDYKLQVNKPYVSKIDTIREKFEQYNQLKRGDYIDSIKKIELK